MTTKQEWNEMNLTGELRDWHYFRSENKEYYYVVGSIWHSPHYQDGQNVTVRVKEVRDYRDHMIFVTEGKYYYKAEMKFKRSNGVSNI